MNKKPEQNASAPLERRLSEWLSSQGYPLEMRVAAAFRNAGFTTYLSSHFTDPETATDREIYVVAWKSVEKFDVTIQVSIVVECKLSRDYPWVLFLGTGGLTSRSRSQALLSLGSSLGKQFLARTRRRHDLADAPLFAPARLAYGLTQGLTSKQDVAYAAAQSAVKAGIWRTQIADAESQYDPTLEVTIPAVVIEGRLFEYFLDESNEEVLNEVSNGLVLWHSPVASSPSIYLRVLNVEHLNQFVADALQTVEYLTACESEIEAVSNRWWREYDRIHNEAKQS